MAHTASNSRHVLLVECPDQRGLVHEITGVLLRHQCNVTSNHEFVDVEANRFFMRTEFTGEASMLMSARLSAADNSPSIQLATILASAPAFTDVSK